MRRPTSLAADKIVTFSVRSFPVSLVCFSTIATSFYDEINSVLHNDNSDSATTMKNVDQVPTYCAAIRNALRNANRDWASKLKIGAIG